MNYQDLTHTLIESFNALADEVQNLIDRKTILEHKLRYAHEQYQYLADKYAPAVSEVSETLAKLQLPPDVHHPALAIPGVVPLPKPSNRPDNAQIALFIREGRKVARELSGLTATTAPTSKGSVTSSKGGVGRRERTSTAMTALSTTTLEQDFTVEGKKGQLGCPFATNQSSGQNNGPGEPGPDPESTKPRDNNPNTSGAMIDPTPHHSSDPICAAMFEETTSQPAPPSAGGGAAKCPIRYLDQHSAEEIAHYVETHKHELPRSHEVCIERYQRNEDQIRKLDAKYGSLVGLIRDLSQLHRPMLPAPAQDEDDGRGAAGEEELDDAPNRRVEDWAQDVVSAGNATEPERPPSIPASGGILSSRSGHDKERRIDDPDLDRESHFDRPLKEVRVGESPSRPWGISVPLPDPVGEGGNRRPVSPPPAPVQMPKVEPETQQSRSATSQARARSSGNGASKCPFSHLAAQADGSGSSAPPHPFLKAEEDDNEYSSQRNGSLTGDDGDVFGGDDQQPPHHHHQHLGHSHKHHRQDRSSTVAAANANPTPVLPSHTPLKQEPLSRAIPHAAFINPPPQFGVPVAAGGHRHHSVEQQLPYAGPAQQQTQQQQQQQQQQQHQQQQQQQQLRQAVPQMLFTGPVFIGYPIEQAIQFIQHFQNRQ